MGGFSIRVQSFGCYQAIEWLSNDGSTFSEKVNAVRRISKLIDGENIEDVIKLNVASRLIEELEKTKSQVLKVKDNVYKALIQIIKNKITQNSMKL
jgi:non-homologous end joining protein Ku